MSEQLKDGLLVRQEVAPEATSQETRTHNARQLVSFQLLHWRAQQGDADQREGATLQDDRYVDPNARGITHVKLTCDSYNRAMLEVTDAEGTTIYDYNAEAAQLTAQLCDADGLPSGEMTSFGEDETAEQAYLVVRDALFELNYPRSA